MEQWLKDYAGWGAVGLFNLFLLLTLYCRKSIWALIKHVFSVSKVIHETDAQLIEGYERQTRLITGQREQETRAKEDAIRGAARQQVRILDLVEQLELKEDVNKRDRIARIIYLRHLRSCGDDIDEIEREIKCEVERRVISDGLSN